MAVVDTLVLVAGLTLLWWAGDRAVRYAIEITELFGVSSFAVGFIVMSVSTGLPEIVTAVVSALTDASGLSAGNLLGAGLANLTFVLGLAVITAGTMAISTKDEKTLLKILGLITVVATGIVFTSRLTRLHGILLLAAYAGSVYVLQRGGLMEKVVKEEQKEAEVEIGEEVVLADRKGTVAKFLGSLGLVVVGAHLAVDSAKTIATSIGIPLETIGATIVAMGTTLPELTLELNAVKRKEYALALGDLFGSTLVNMSLVLGLLSLLSPTAVNTIPLLGSIAYMALTLGFLWYAMTSNSGLHRDHGIALVAIFVFYLIEEIGVVQFLYILPAIS